MPELISSPDAGGPPAPGARGAAPSPAAITRAFDALTPEVMRERGSLKWTRHSGDVIGAWVAEMDLGTAPAITRVLQRAVAEGTLGYMPPGLAQQAREETARYQGRAFGWRVAVEEVSLLPDVLSALGAIIAHHTRAGSPVIVPTPAYMPFLSIPGRHGRECLQIPARVGREDGSPRWELDLEAIESAMVAGAGLLVLCNPWNPVGRVLSEAELDAVAALSQRHGVPVFADEIHGPLVLEPGLAHIPYASRPTADPDLTFTATAVSKGWNIPGLRCAQLIASGGARRAWEAQALSAALSEQAAALGAMAAVAALREGQGWLEQVRSYLRANRDLVHEGLADVTGLEMTAPEGTYLAWLDCRGLGLEEPGEYFLRHGVAMNEGAAFGRDWSGFCRLNLATGRAIEEETLRRIVAAARARAAAQR
ncbi:MalY/PatB family protein [Actinomyces bowdenii]|uniref:cysteine-S-conjugate beta-lyase n=1 Tax=Actinomyces bowdenii TaxID=131109 RepID=A0A3P1V685_9ACTO|nr:aminotransferase class I/II-fold pyridoxal phosphate-dependent enzyme [Actinomyces bowdenii]RRD29702.1 aminotransferase class I/II-fold pyridoxal phosphate-dependent enzyme [Actinomyces bowdenii]